ncbi:MAG: alkaline phosphatase [Candidatus Heimdallarchaeota archaeon]|nr:alkaline phosphatase [Candidatus Heimdallarchaeota archaeon]
MTNKKKKFLGCLITLLILLGNTSTIAVIQGNYFSGQITANNYSIILMIGDGMGYNHVALGRYVEVGKGNNLTMENLPKQYSVYTNNINDLTTDSAAAGTALATGEKTYNGNVAVSISGEILKTILETAVELRKSTGIVTTTFIQHATPACFMTHINSRSNYEEITRQIIENANVDILLGGGTSYINEEQIETMVTKGYALVANKTTLESQSSGRILGLFAGGHMPYEKDRNLTLIPSIAEMTRKSLEILSQDPDGFFLMVEGGRIDHAGHANDKIGVALETIAFDKAVKEALRYTEVHPNTILLVTADHETGGLTIISDNLDEILPMMGNTEELNRTIRMSRANDIIVDWKTGGHTSTCVPLYAFGKALEGLAANYQIDNTQIHQLMNDYFLGNDLILEKFSEPTSMNQIWLFFSIFVISFIIVNSHIRRRIKQKRK